MQHERKRKKEARKKKRAEEAAAQAALSDPAAVATANRQRAELELITRGEDSGEEQGFNMKAIEVGKKRKRAKKRGKKEAAVRAEGGCDEPTGESSMHHGMEWCICSPYGARALQHVSLLSFLSIAGRHSGIWRCRPE